MIEPDVSVVIATYNRSGVLRHTLDVLRHQTHTNWEAIIVGDACTDDTAAVVAACDDARLQFVNLPENHGEQSAPNNEGVARAQGSVVAFLNHDDFWRPDHLTRALAHLSSTGADVVYSWIAQLLPDGTPVLLGVSPDGVYSPLVTVPASAWVVRRELAQRLPWRNGWTMRLTPSQDWLWRAWHERARIVELRHLSVLALPSGTRKGSYRGAASNDDPNNEHTRWRDRVLKDDRWAEEILTAYLHAQANGGRLPPSTRVLRRLSWVARNAGSKAVVSMGWHPLAAWLAVRHPGRGGFLTWLRSERGLPARDTSR